MLSRLIGASRYLVLIAVAGSLLTATILLLHGLVDAVRLFELLVRSMGPEKAPGKELVVDAIGVVDVFLVGTVLYIIAAGLYELFIGDAPLPEWLQIHTLDELKTRLAGVVIVGMVAAFFGVVVEWTGGFDILALGGAIAAVSLAVGIVFRPGGESGAG